MEWDGPRLARERTDRITKAIDRMLDSWDALESMPLPVCRWCGQDEHHDCEGYCSCSCG